MCDEKVCAKGVCCRLTLFRCRSILMILDMGCGQKGLNILSHRLPLVSTARKFPSTVHNCTLMTAA